MFMYQCKYLMLYSYVQILDLMICFFKRNCSVFNASP